MNRYVDDEGTEYEDEYEEEEDGEGVLNLLSAMVEEIKKLHVANQKMIKLLTDIRDFKPGISENIPKVRNK